MALEKKLLRLLVLVLLTFYVSAAKATCTLRYTNIIRSTGNFNASIITKVPMYTPLSIKGEKGNWLKVQGLNFTGWIHKKLVDKKINCLITLNTKEPQCPGYRILRDKPISKNEGLKILKNEIGCSKVKDVYGNQFYIFTGNVWPQTNVKNLEI